MEDRASTNTKQNLSIYKIKQDIYLSLQPNAVDSVRSNNLRLNYQRFTPSECKDVGIKVF